MNIIKVVLAISCLFMSDVFGKRGIDSLGKSSLYENNSPKSNRFLPPYYTSPLSATPYSLSSFADRRRAALLGTYGYGGYGGYGGAASIAAQRIGSVGF